MVLNNCNPNFFYELLQFHVLPPFYIVPFPKILKCCMSHVGIVAQFQFALIKRRLSAKYAFSPNWRRKKMNLRLNMIKLKTPIGIFLLHQIGCL